MARANLRDLREQVYGLSDLAESYDLASLPSHWQTDSDLEHMTLTANRAAQARA